MNTVKECKEDEKKEVWKDKGYSFYSNTKCEYFPCHVTDNSEEFNCLFCYCPLYTMGTDCGGNFSRTASGIKNCVGCMIPHKKENYGFIIEMVIRNLQGA